MAMQTPPRDKRNELGVLAGSRLKNLSARLKAAREARKFTQTELARRSGVSRAAIAKIETEKVDNPRGIDALAKALGVSPAWLLFGVSEDGSIADETIKLAVAIQMLPEESRQLVSNLVGKLGGDDAPGKLISKK